VETGRSDIATSLRKARGSGKRDHPQDFRKGLAMRGEGRRTKTVAKKFQTMKSKFILCVALVLGGLFCSRAAAQNVSETNKWHRFPTFPPIANANPSIIHQMSVCIPMPIANA
jgi:hypothetical protein